MFPLAPLRAPAPQSLVVNVSSIVGSNTDPTVSAVTPGGYAYRASKVRRAGRVKGPPMDGDSAEQKRHRYW